MFEIRRQFGLGMLVLTVSGLAGCHDPQATALRQQRIEATLNVIDGREADGSWRMQRTLQVVEDSERRHAVQHRDNRRRLADWARHDRLRWQDNQPLYRRRMADLFAGDADNIKRSFRAMFY